MYYKIQKSLGNVSAVSTDSISTSGVCVETIDYKSYSNASIVVYINGKSEDIQINGWTFPCVYNRVEQYAGDDIYGGSHAHRISFECVDPYGEIHKVENKTLYGGRESIEVEYFYSLLYYISCCQSMEQFEELYKFIIDNEWFGKDRKRKAAVQVLSFIENFTPRLSAIEDNEFLAGLKQKINIKFKEAKEIIAESNCPD